jgi:hypothetical protein
MRPLYLLVDKWLMILNERIGQRFNLENLKNGRFWMENGDWESLD